MKKVIKILFVISLLLFSFMPTFAVAETVSAEGESDFYYFGTSGVTNAKYFANKKLDKLCKEKGLEFYKGPIERQATGMEYSLINYTNLKCKTKKSGEKKCTVKATGICISKNNEYFSLSCGEGKKHIKGRSEMLPGGGLRIIANDGAVYTVSKQNVLADGLTKKGRMAPLTDGPYGVLCGGSANKSDKYVHKVQKYLRGRMKAHIRTCKAIQEKGGDIPAECETVKPGSGAAGSRG
ncbi:MAG: hypothetical protein COB41_06915 [Proteobacteria bacterium]|nr:MAG: hypothetical protein COB41_06915 [Pseudomonadota bacterium]